MAFDCYLKDRTAIVVNHFPIDEILHRGIFSKNFQPMTFPILARLKDYYNDHFIQANEIPHLITELQLLKPQLPVQLQHSITEFIDLLSDDRIYTMECFCD